MRTFGEAESKVMRAYAQSGQYYTIVESRIRLTVMSRWENMKLWVRRNLLLWSLPALLRP